MAWIVLVIVAVAVWWYRSGRDQMNTSEAVATKLLYAILQFDTATSDHPAYIRQAAVDHYDDLKQRGLANEEIVLLLKSKATTKEAASYRSVIVLFLKFLQVRGTADPEMTEADALERWIDGQRAFLVERLLT